MEDRNHFEAIVPRIYELGGSGLAYVAYEGKVYDVSQSFLWRRGTHQFRHHAGQDLTEALREAPTARRCWKDFPWWAN